MQHTPLDTDHCPHCNAPQGTPERYACGSWNQARSNITTRTQACRHAATLLTALHESELRRAEWEHRANRVQEQIASWLDERAKSTVSKWQLEIAADLIRAGAWR